MPWVVVFPWRFSFQTYIIRAGTPNGMQSYAEALKDTRFYLEKRRVFLNREQAELGRFGKASCRVQSVGQGRMACLRKASRCPKCFSRAPAYVSGWQRLSVRVASC